MLIYVGFAILCLVSLLSPCVIIWIYRREKRELESRLLGYFSAPDDKTPSSFAILIQNIAQVFGTYIAQSLAASLMGKQSGIARELDGIEKDLMVEKMANGNPLLGSVLSSPAVQKRLNKNPLLGLLLAGISNIKPGGSSGGNNHSGQAGVKFNL